MCKVIKGMLICIGAYKESGAYSNAVKLYGSRYREVILVDSDFLPKFQGCRDESRGLYRLMRYF